MNEAHITLWPGGLYDTKGESLDTTWPEWFARLSVATQYQGDAKHPGWTAAVFDPLERNDDNVTGLSALVLDYDDGVTVESAAEAWGDLYGFIHTTRKHKPAHHRFRVILPFTRIVTRDEYDAIWRWARATAEAAQHRVDGSTKNASRFWFLPGGSDFETRNLDGRPIDPDPILASEREDMMRRYAENASRPMPNHGTDKLKRASAYLAKCAPAISGQGGHQAAWSAALAITVGFDLSVDQACDLLRSEYNPRCNPPWNAKELRHKVESADRDGKRQRGYLLNAPRPPLRVVHSVPLKGTGTDGPSPQQIQPEPTRLLKRGDHVELAALTLYQLESSTNPLTHDDGEFWRYDDEAGVWRLVPTEQVEHTVAGFAGRWIEEGEKMKLLKISDSSCKGAARIARNTLCTRFDRKRFSDAAPGVAFRNGFVRVTNGTIELLPHAPSNMIRAGLPFDYDPQSKHPELDAFFESTFADASEQDRADRVALLQEFIGAALLGMAPSYQRCLLLYGTGNNGKSQVLAIARSAFPEGTIVSLPPQKWDERFGLGRLVGALANVCDEMPQREILASEVFKGVVTGEPQTTEYKNRDAFDFRPRAGHIFSANTLPTTTDHTAGFFRRFIVLPLTRDFDKAAEKTIDAGPKVVAAERAAIAAWAIAGAARLQQQGTYTVPESANALRDTWLRDSDSVRMFVQEQCEPTPEPKQGISADGMRASILYQEYVTWAKASGFIPVNIANFGKRATGAGATSYASNGRTVYRLRTRSDR